VLTNKVIKGDYELLYSYVWDADMQYMTNTMRSAGSMLRCVIGLLAIVLTVSCSSKPAFLLDSDLPSPAGMSNRETSGIDRKQDLLVGINSVFAGWVIDASASLDTLKLRFSRSGWSVSRSSGNTVLATGIFVKGGRSCRVRVMKNQLDPAMSRISYLVYETAASDKEGPRSGDG
jgi:hypothetical protein